MKIYLLAVVIFFSSLFQKTNAQVTENVIGWSSWVNWSTLTADLGITANLSMPLATSGGTAGITFSDSGDGFGQRAFTTGWSSGSGTKAWQFQMTTLKYNTLKFSCKMMGTNTPGSFLGPRDFKLQFSLNGSSWTDVIGGSLTAGNGNGNFNSLTNVALPVNCENQTAVYLRMVMTSNTAVTGGTVNGGQSHIDDILVTGISVPEAPTDIALSNNFLLTPINGSVASATTLGTLTSTDFNLGNTFSYTLVSGTGSGDNALFGISSNTLSTASAISKGTYNIRIRSTDNSSLYYEEPMTIIIGEPDAVMQGTRTRVSNMGPDGNTSFNATAGTAVAYNSTNNEYFTVWQGDDNTSPLVDNELEIFGQRTNANTGATVGSRLRISFMGTNGLTTFKGATPSIAYNATNNEYLVVWSGDHNSGSLVLTEFEIWGQRIDAATGTLTGSMFRISTMGPDGNLNFDATVPDVSWNATNNEYMVVWLSDDNTSPLVDNEFEIYGQRVSNTGTLSGSRIRVSTMGPDGSTLYAAATPAIAWNATNNQYLVVWHGDDNTSPLVDNENEVFGQLLTNTGGLSGSRIRISTMGPNGNTGYSGVNADVAYNGDDNEYLVVWQGDDNTAPLVDNEIEIFGQRVGATGTLSGSRIRISDMGPDGNISYAANVPKVIYHPAIREYWVVWQGDDNATSVDNETEIFMQRITASTGAEIGTNDTRISYMGSSSSTSFVGQQPAIAYNSTDAKAIVAWRGDDNTAPLVDNEFEMFSQPLFIALSTLPVKWLSFTAHQSGKSVVLDWATGSEQSTKDFTVQYSQDGNTWNNIGVVAAAGNSNSRTDYSFTHQTPGTGKNYYRILQADIDGHKSYSKIAVIEMTEKNMLTVFPNPATDNITLQLASDKNSVIRIYTNEGALVKAQDGKGMNIVVNIQSLPAGIYRVKAEQSNKVYIQTFLKK